MYITRYKCLICHHELVRDFPETEIWDVEFVVNDDELALANSLIHCDGCGQVAPMEMTIFDDVICEVLSQKIISPMNHSNADLFEMMGITGDRDIPCPCCGGSGHCEIAKKAHRKEDMLYIDYGLCPVCEGKGYIPYTEKDR